MAQVSSIPAPTTSGVVQEIPTKQKPQKKSSAVPKPKSPVESRPTKTLPTDRISFDKQLDILRAYAAASAGGTKSATLDEVSAVVKMAVTTISMANPFFSNIGLITKSDMSYLPSGDVVGFLRAYDWNKETASRKLAPTISQTWFWEAISPLVSYGPQEQDALITALAEACSAGPEYRKQLGILIDYAVAAGLVERDGTQIRAPKSSSAATSMASRTDTPKAVDSAADIAKSRVVTAFTQSPEGSVNFNISVKVDMAEFAGWQADRIGAFFAGIAKVLAAKANIELEAGS
jgi:hypothetical protein